MIRTKLNACVNNALHIWEDGNADKVTQLLFCDPPKNDGTSLIYAYDDTAHKRDAIEKAMGGVHSGITDVTLCTVDDDELLEKLYGM